MKMKKRTVLQMASTNGELDENLLNELWLKISIMEQQNLQLKKGNAEIVKEIKSKIEERVKCVCRV